MRKCIPEGRIWLNFHLHLSNSASINCTDKKNQGWGKHASNFDTLCWGSGHLAWDVGRIQLAFQTVSLARQGPCLWCCTIQILRRQCCLSLAVSTNLSLLISIWKLRKVWCILKLIVSLSSCVQLALAFQTVRLTLTELALLCYILDRF